MQSLTRSIVAVAFVLSLVAVANTASAGRNSDRDRDRDRYSDRDRDRDRDHKSRDHKYKSRDHKWHPGHTSRDCNNQKPPVVPEPTSALVFGAGLLAVSAATRRREAR